MCYFSVYGCVLCLVRYFFVISTSVIDCLGRFVPEMTYYVSSGTLNLAQLNSEYVLHFPMLLTGSHGSLLTFWHFRNRIIIIIIKCFTMNVLLGTASHNVPN